MAAPLHLPLLLFWVAWVRSRLSKPGRRSPSSPSHLPRHHASPLLHSLHQPANGSRILKLPFAEHSWRHPSISRSPLLLPPPHSPLHFAPAPADRQPLPHRPDRETHDLTSPAIIRSRSSITSHFRPISLPYPPGPLGSEPAACGDTAPPSIVSSFTKRRARKPLSCFPPSSFHLPATVRRGSVVVFLFAAAYLRLRQSRGA